MKHKLKLALILGVEFIAIAVVLILIFFSGKKQYTVIFDIDEGTLLSGSLEQHVTQGHSATPPSVAKEGHYLRGWSGNYREVTHNVKVTAIWEYVTTTGIEYEETEGYTYSKISGCYDYLAGKVYVGAYHNDLKVLEIKDDAFRDCSKITNIYLLDGILIIGDRAFQNCSEMVSIELPNTTLKIGEYAFSDCRKLESITLPEDIEELGAYAFSGCSALTEVRIPSTIKKIDKSAFEDCANLKNVIFYEVEEEEDFFEDEQEDEDAEKPESLAPYLEIADRAFSNCYALESINLPKTLKSIGRYAFSSCSSLKTVIVPKDTVSISYSVFDSPTTTVYVYAESRPSGWVADWISNNVTVVYGYNGEDITNPDNDE